MSYLYLASPYSHPDKFVMETRYLEALDALDWLLHNKIWAFSPIVHCHNLTAKHQRDFKYWREFNHLMILNSRGITILQCDGWDESLGVADEVGYATALDLPISHLTKRGPNYDFTTIRAPGRIDA